ncbi:ANKRD60 [Branchiostoma lanceolatum]|uniref:ANKRD60 protein n=1 Tax=Branchiostoma lanceolatum TaxID=7740 RepID=A0A8K0A5K4_BRALA|nr:ANKRD60 [Branchiostoma lanceolatum]
MAGRTAKTGKKTGKVAFVPLRTFSLKVLLVPTGEMFTIGQVYPEMQVWQLKESVELEAGIPSNLQRLSYLDEGDMHEDSDLRYNDIVQGGTIKLKVWSQWQTLVEAAAEGDIEKVFQLGVTPDTKFHSPTSDYMGPRQRRAWFAERAAVALFIASNRGHLDLMHSLMDKGADVNATTPSGRTALHAAAARGRGECVDILLEKGARINAADREGKTALTIAADSNHKKTERHLFLFQWQVRATEMRANGSSQDVNLKAHQLFDSKTPTWLKGTYGQLYMAQILPPSEFQGTGFASPKSLKFASRENEKGLEDAVDEDDADEEDEDRDEDTESDAKASEVSRHTEVRFRAKLEDVDSDSGSGTRRTWSEKSGSIGKPILRVRAPEVHKEDKEDKMSHRWLASKNFIDEKEDEKARQLRAKPMGKVTKVTDHSLLTTGTKVLEGRSDAASVPRVQ